MGFAKEKYTEEYYDKLYKDRQKDGPIRKDQVKILDSLILKDTKILDLGCGCGEVIRYCLDHGASCVGVDFASVAIARASKLCPEAKFSCSEIKEIVNSKMHYDYTLMMDSIEHIPAKEIGAILDWIVKHARYLVVQTPAYREYEDFIKQKHYKFPTPTDNNPLTRGMHCTKYSRESLVKLLTSHGFINESYYIWRTDAKF